MHDPLVVQTKSHERWSENNTTTSTLLTTEGGPVHVFPGGFPEFPPTGGPERPVPHVPSSATGHTQYPRIGNLRQPVVVVASVRRLEHMDPPPPTSTFDAPGALPYSLPRARTHTPLMDRAPCTSHRLQTRVATSGGRLALAGRLRFLPHQHQQHRQQRLESSSCFCVSSLPGACLLLPAGLFVGPRNNKVWRRLRPLLSLVVIKARQGFVESAASLC